MSPESCAAASALHCAPRSTISRRNAHALPYRCVGVSLGDFELDRPLSLFLDDGSSFSNPAADANIVTFKLDEIAPSELAVDRKVEQGEVAFAVLQLKPGPNGPYILRFKRALLADHTALVPGCFWACG